MSAGKILVVEDNPITMKMVRVALKAEGYSVFEAPDGKTALEMMRSQGPDLILQDLVLPDIGGCDLAAQLRALPGGADIPLLAFTGMLSAAQEARVSSSPFDKFLIKPVAPSLLVATIRGFLHEAVPTPQTDGKGRHILVADDNRMQLKVLRLRLTHLGFVVTTAVDGQEALALARTIRPDAIVSDVLMPGLDGFRLCHAVRTDPELCGIPVVLVSSHYVEREDRRLAREAGASSLVLREPNNGKVILGLVDALSEKPTGQIAKWTELHDGYLHRVVRQLERQTALAASLREEAAPRGAALTVLNAISDTLARQLNIEDSLEEILAQCLDAAGLSVGAIYLVDAVKGTLALRAQAGYSGSDLEKARDFFGQRDIFLNCIASGKPVAMSLGDREDHLLDRPGDPAALLVPVQCREARLGALLLVSRMRSLTGDDWIAFSQSLATQLGQAITVGRAFSQLAAADQRYRTAHARYTRLSESGIVGIGIADVHGNVLEANDAYCKIVGFSRADILAGLAGWEKYTPEEWRECDRRALDQLKAEGIASAWEKELLRKDGTRARIMIGIAMLEYPQCITFVTDLSELKKQRDMVHSLEAENARIHEAERIKSQFLAFLSHELRTPLNAIIGFSDILVDGSSGPLNEKQQRQVTNINQSGRHLLTLVNDFLDLAKVEAGKLTVLSEICDPTSIANEAVATLQPLADAKRITVVSIPPQEKSPLIRADAGRIRQVFYNLLSNAIKYSHAGGQVRVVCCAIEKNVRISVIDGGLGIAPDELARLFVPFTQLENARGRGGTGLGLALVKHLVELMGGRVGVESVLNVGSTFFVEFPITGRESPWRASS